MLRTVIVALALWLPTTEAYYMYAERIPNGDNVPHPCKPNNLWHGVGHQNSNGGGARNPFGQDFAANGHQWTPTLCSKDSDGDGRTNGQELGDPDCVWREGQTPSVTSGITHPGVCDPWNEGQCVGKNSWVDCSIDDTFSCDAIKDAEVRNITIRFPRTKVPARETTYICFNFELPDDREYHLIASKPLIDNQNVMHHIVLSRCESDVGLLSEPKECLMGAEGCSEMMDLWAVGGTGNCMIPQAGYPIGKGHTKIVSMQMHWTNPNEVDTWFDSSGMVLYYTPRLRQYNAGILSIGQLSINIPPGQSHWVEKGGCGGACTERLMSGDINMFRVLHHMHYLGNRQNVTLTRKGERKEHLISEDNPYHYDSPVAHELEPPVTVNPGDSLSTYCQYGSLSRPKTTTYGEGSFDEMCFSFIFYYPKENMDTTHFCNKYKRADMCVAEKVCDVQKYNASSPAMARAIRKIQENCDATGATCRAECPLAVREVLEDNSCLREGWDFYLDTVYTYVWDPTILKFMTAIQSCGSPVGDHEVDPHPGMTTKRPEPEHSTHKPMKPDTHGNPGNWFLSLVKSLDARPLLQNIIMNVNYNYGHGAAKKAADNDHDDSDDSDDHDSHDDSNDHDSHDDSDDHDNHDDSDDHDDLWH